MMDLSRARQLVGSLQAGAQFLACLLFLFYWPLANLYWVVVAGMTRLGMQLDSPAQSLWNPSVIAVVMMFATPLWAGLVYLLYHLALALSLISMRPVALLLAAVAWLSWHACIPSGHFHSGSIPMLLNREASGLYPLLYSVLAVLGWWLVKGTFQARGAADRR